MVARPRLHHFWGDESGLSLTEGMIVFPIVMLVFAAFVEFGYAMFQYNATVKASQFGARLAAVSDSIAADFDPSAAAGTSDPLVIGKSMPIGGSWTCDGANPVTCNLPELHRIVYGSTTAMSCQPVGTAGIRPAMCHLNPRIQPANVVVRYERTGLGYWGRPQGAIVTIRVQVEGITFDLPIIGALLGINQVTIPILPVTVTSEDLSTTVS